MEVSIEEPQREPGGVWLVPGSFPVDQLADLFGEPVELGDEYEATTLGGLVSEIEGRIPLAGEVVLLEPVGLRMEIVASTDRRVERLRVFPPSATQAGHRDQFALPIEMMMPGLAEGPAGFPRLATKTETSRG